MALIFAKQIRRGDAHVYGEWCGSDGAATVAAPETDFTEAIVAADTILCWGGVDGANVVDLQAVFESRHPFPVSLTAFGPFKSAVHVERLRELYQRLLRKGRLRWQTRGGQSRLWYDPVFYKLAQCAECK